MIAGVVLVFASAALSLTNPSFLPPRRLFLSAPLYGTKSLGHVLAINTLQVVFVILRVFDTCDLFSAVGEFG